MEYAEIGGTKIPVLGLGTWKMGGYIRADHSKDYLYIKAIMRAIKNGMTHIDTAEIYSAGHSEELAGSAIKYFKREKFFITTKVSPHHLLTKSQVLSAAEGSLKRLETDYIDLYLVHWPPPVFFSKAIKNAMSAFDELVEKGIVRYIGVSNFSIRQLKEAQSMTKNKIVTNQVEYSLMDKSPEKGLLDFCQKNDIILTAYSPLGQGTIKSGWNESLDMIAKKYKKTAVQVALRYLLDHPNVIAIPRTTSETHLKEILGCLGWHLKKEDMEILRGL